MKRGRRARHKMPSPAPYDPHGRSGISSGICERDCEGLGIEDGRSSLFLPPCEVHSGLPSIGGRARPKHAHRSRGDTIPWAPATFLLAASERRSRFGQAVPVYAKFVSTRGVSRPAKPLHWGRMKMGATATRHSCLSQTHFHLQHFDFAVNAHLQQSYVDMFVALCDSRSARPGQQTYNRDRSELGRRQYASAAAQHHMHTC